MRKKKTTKMPQMKQQKKTPPPKKLNEIEVSNLPKTEFKHWLQGCSKTLAGEEMISLRTLTEK